MGSGCAGTVYGVCIVCIVCTHGEWMCRYSLWCMYCLYSWGVDVQVQSMVYVLCVLMGSGCAGTVYSVCTVCTHGEWMCRYSLWCMYCMYSWGVDVQVQSIVYVLYVLMGSGCAGTAYSVCTVCTHGEWTCRYSLWCMYCTTFTNVPLGSGCAGGRLCTIDTRYALCTVHYTPYTIHDTSHTHALTLAHYTLYNHTLIRSTDSWGWACR
jgi:hypothetical protein